MFNVVNLHVYHYAGNNPVKYVDPDGREDIYFIYTYTNTDRDKKMKKSERDTVNDDIKWAKNKGFTVKVIENGNKKDILNAIADDEAKIIITSGHGGSKGIQSSDGKIVSPSDVGKSKKGKNLKIVIFENCHQGDIKDKWKKSFGNNVEIVGLKGTTTTYETKRFNGWGFFDRQSTTLRGYLKK